MPISSIHTLPAIPQVPAEWSHLFESLPGGDLIRQGYSDLASGNETVASLLVRIGGPALNVLGLSVPSTSIHSEHELYDLIARSDQDSAHSRYNALLRTLAIFVRAAACVKK